MLVKITEMFVLETCFIMLEKKRVKSRAKIKLIQQTPLVCNNIDPDAANNSQGFQ